MRKIKKKKKIWKPKTVTQLSRKKFRVPNEGDQILKYKILLLAENI